MADFTLNSFLLMLFRRNSLQWEMYMLVDCLCGCVSSALKTDELLLRGSCTIFRLLYRIPDKFTKSMYSPEQPTGAYSVNLYVSE